MTNPDPYAGLSSDDRALAIAGCNPHIVACKTREDIEVLTKQTISDELWTALESKAGEHGMPVGIHLRTAWRDAGAQVYRQRAQTALEELFFKPDGTKRTEQEVEQHMEAVLTIDKDRKDRERFRQAQASLDAAYDRKRARGTK